MFVSINIFWEIVTLTKNKVTCWLEKDSIMKTAYTPVIG